MPAPPAEGDDLTADPEFLSRIAEAAGGKLIQPGQMDEFIARIMVAQGVEAVNIIPDRNWNLKNAEEAYAFTKLGNDVFDQVAALPFPTVAMIHGFCMGGGTELALACKYRIADDGPKTKMALPEVMIGIVPGWGGAQRMPKLIGAAQALDRLVAVTNEVA